MQTATALELSEAGHVWEALKRFGFTRCAMCAERPCCGLLIGSKKKGAKRPRCPECHIASEAKDPYANIAFYFQKLEKHAEVVFRRLWAGLIFDPVLDTRDEMVKGPPRSHDSDPWETAVGGGVDGGADAAMALAWDAARQLNRHIDDAR